jgi:hypothetical protein
MNEITRFLDEYLRRTCRLTIDPVEANALLSKAGILHDSKDRPGKPLRDKLRNGELPHAYQVAGKGSNWIIPLSNKTQSFYSNSQLTTQKIATTKVIPQSISKNKDIQTALMDEMNFRSARSIDGLVPNDSGIYCIRVSDIAKLPKPFNDLLGERQHNVFYIGIATDSLLTRFLNQELRAKGHGTFFRSIGALLGFRPQKGSLSGKVNKRNCKFVKEDQEKIINWINETLTVNWITVKGNLETIETELIAKYTPLINLSKNPARLQLLSDLRKECIDIANAID